MEGEREKETTEIYTCAGCGRVMVHRLPKGLKGEFWHIGCRREGDGYGVLDAPVIY